MDDEPDRDACGGCMGVSADAEPAVAQVVQVWAGGVGVAVGDVWEGAGDEAVGRFQPHSGQGLSAGVDARSYPHSLHQFRCARRHCRSQRGVPSTMNHIAPKNAMSMSSPDQIGRSGISTYASPVFARRSHVEGSWNSRAP